MSIISANLAGKFISSVIQTPTRRLCNLCGKNAFVSTIPANLRLSYGDDKHQMRQYTDDTKNKKWKFKRPTDPNDESSDSGRLTGLQGIAGKYKVFDDFNSPIILDVDEERALLRSNPEQFEEVVTKMDPYAEMNLEHGKTGVFDIEELVNVLRMENASNIVVISIPADRQYVDYMVIVTGKSNKHIWALSEFIRGLYKRKRHQNEPIPQLEGDKNDRWLAMDLGNIALHVFTREAREFYDLEILWAVGHEYDDLVHKKEENYIQLLEQYTHPAISGLTPADTQPVVELTKKSSVEDSCELRS